MRHVRATHLAPLAQGMCVLVMYVPRIKMSMPVACAFGVCTCHVNYPLCAGYIQAGYVHYPHVNTNARATYMGVLHEPCACALMHMTCNECYACASPSNGTCLTNSFGLNNRRQQFIIISVVRAPSSCHHHFNVSNRPPSCVIANAAFEHPSEEPALL
jgi:hypothetical protein